MLVTRASTVRGRGTKCKIPEMKFREELDGTVGWLPLLTRFDVWCFVHEPI
jgi:hypothetical protein